MPWKGPEELKAAILQSAWKAALYGGLSNMVKFEKMGRAAQKTADQADFVRGIGGNIRVLLNRLCSQPGTRYLEIGTWHGSSLGSALLGNPDIHAVSVDNRSMEGSGEARISTAHVVNVLQLPGATTAVMESDGFVTDLSAHGPFDVYFYDGDHSEEAHAAALSLIGTRYLAPLSVVVIDDYNLIRAIEGTEHGLSRLILNRHGRILVDLVIQPEVAMERAGWWNGVRILGLQLEPRK